jgi:hypothetical protein
MEHWGHISQYTEYIERSAQYCWCKITSFTPIEDEVVVESCSVIPPALLATAMISL